MSGNLIFLKMMIVMMKCYVTDLIVACAVDDNLSGKKKQLPCRRTEKPTREIV
jgi:hypothetical protein